jgi:hypothetical protein
MNLESPFSDCTRCLSPAIGALTIFTMSAMTVFLKRRQQGIFGHVGAREAGGYPLATLALPSKMPISEGKSVVFFTAIFYASAGSRELT